MTRSSRFKFAGWWLLIGLIAAGVCALRWPAARFVDEPLPFGVDSFYHARRILDTAADPGAFYEIDTKIHAPEGSLLAWPWGYDYAMAWLVRIGHGLGLADSPASILIWLPVAAVFLAIGLLMLVARRLGLSEGPVIVAGLAAALSPLTQNLFGVGQIDHHLAEYLFVLATLACGLRWLAQRDDARAAVALGVVLGAAPAIHNGLFILQLPVLASLFVLWLQDTRTPLRTTLLFAAALVLTTIAILVPSLPFRLGMFEFYLLSWFHLYVAVGTAIATITLASFATSKRSVALLAVIALVLLTPLARQIVLARAFLVGTITRLDTIVEMHSVSSLAMSAAGRMSLSLTYTPLIWGAPAAAIYCAWRGWRERTTARVLFWICCILGLAMLMTQVRLHYFGSFALYLPWLILVEACLMRWQQHRKVIMLSVGLVLLLVYWMPMRYQLAAVTAPAGDPAFRVLRPILEDLRKACARDPGIVLADNDAGHYIRYYTNCSVIANNFLLTRQHEQKIRQIDYLTSLPAGAFPGAAPFVRYILMRPANVFIGDEKSGEHVEYMSYSQSAAQLIKDLLLQPLDRVPPNYVLIEQAHISDENGAGTIPYIRLYEVNPVAPRPTDGDATGEASLKSVDH